MKHFIYCDKNARKWDDGLPLGNGQLGAMVMGRVNDETIIINEETLWYGKARSRLNPDAKENIGEIRRLLLEERVSEAEFLAKTAFTSTPKYNNPYQPVGDLRITLSSHNGKVTNYRRFLDLQQAVAVVEYEMDGIQYRRVHLVSQRYNVIAVRLTAEKDGKPVPFTLCANLNRKPFEDASGVVDDCTAVSFGQCAPEGLRYYAGVRMCAQKVQTRGDFVLCENQEEVVLYVAAKTDFMDKTDLKETVLARLAAAEKAGFSTLYQEHIADYQALYGRMSFSLTEGDMGVDADGNTGGNAFDPLQKTTAALLQEVRDGDDSHEKYLAELLVAFARYLMISSSYRCQLPANLQGIWNGSYEPPWQSQFTININTEMNYWFVEEANLSECHLPLFTLVDRMVENGEKVAKELYGAKGFCAHHNTGLFATCDPEGIFAASPFWAMGGCWLATHYYEHYLYTKDEAFLKDRAIPVMKKALLFLTDYLFEEPETGRLLTGPCVSPENTYITPGGEKGALTLAPAMDAMIIRHLIGCYQDSCRVLKLEESEKELLAELTDMKNRIPKITINQYGGIAEWYRPYEEAEPGHRHVSQLYALSPGVEINKNTPELLEAAKKTLERRTANGGGHTGWSRAWLTCFYARLFDGKMVEHHVHELLSHSIQDNFLDTHPPFQIDGNFGIAHGILEAVVQSHAGVIHLLPALPENWKNGALRGVRLRGGVTADILWQNGRLLSLSVTADEAMELPILVAETERLLKLPKGQKITVNF